MHSKGSQATKRSTGSAADAATAAAPGSAALSAGPQPISKKQKQHKWLSNSLKRAEQRNNTSKPNTHKYMQVKDPSVLKPRGPPAGEAALRPAPAAAAAAACTATGQGAPEPQWQCGTVMKPGNLVPTHALTATQHQQRQLYLAAHQQWPIMANGGAQSTAAVPTGSLCVPGIIPASRSNLAHCTLVSLQQLQMQQQRVATMPMLAAGMASDSGARTAAVCAAWAARQQGSLACTPAAAAQQQQVTIVPPAAYMALLLQQQRQQQQQNLLPQKLIKPMTGHVVVTPASMNSIAATNIYSNNPTMLRLAASVLHAGGVAEHTICGDVTQLLPGTSEPVQPSGSKAAVGPDSGAAAHPAMPNGVATVPTCFKAAAAQQGDSGACCNNTSKDETIVATADADRHGTLPLEMDTCQERQEAGAAAAAPAEPCMPIVVPCKPPPQSTELLLLSAPQAAGGKGSASTALACRLPSSLQCTSHCSNLGTKAKECSGSGSAGMQLVGQARLGGWPHTNDKECSGSGSAGIGQGRLGGWPHSECISCHVDGKECSRGSGSSKGNAGLGAVVCGRVGVLGDNCGEELEAKDPWRCPYGFADCDGFAKGGDDCKCVKKCQDAFRSDGYGIVECDVGIGNVGELLEWLVAASSSSAVAAPAAAAAAPAPAAAAAAAPAPAPAAAGRKHADELPDPNDQGLGLCLNHQGEAGEQQQQQQGEQQQAEEEEDLDGSENNNMDVDDAASSDVDLNMIDSDDGVSGGTGMDMNGGAAAAVAAAATETSAAWAMKLADMGV